MLTDTLMRAVSLLLARFTLQNDHQMLFSFWVMVLALHPMLWSHASASVGIRKQIAKQAPCCQLLRHVMPAKEANVCPPARMNGVCLDILCILINDCLGDTHSICIMQAKPC